MESKKSNKLSLTAAIKKKFFSKKKSSKTEKKDGSDKNQLSNSIKEKDAPVNKVTVGSTETNTTPNQCKSEEEEEARCSTSSDNSIIIHEINQDMEKDATPPEEQDVTPPEEQDATPPEEQDVTPPEEQDATPPEEQDVTPPEEQDVTPSEEDASSSEEHKEDVVPNDLSEELAVNENSAEYLNPTTLKIPVMKSPDDEVTNEGTKCPSTLSQEFKRLAKQGWYWGPITRAEAEEKMIDQPNGSFLVRDSSDERYLLSLSFRSNDRTLHTRFEHYSGTFSFYVNDQIQTFESVVDLIDTSMEKSIESGIFCYSRSRDPSSETYPVKLMHPVSRLTQVRSLQYLCRFVIRQLTRVDHLEQLPLPHSIKGFVNKKYF